MVDEKKFIEEPLKKYRIMDFLERKLNRAWIAGIDVQRTPLSTRISLMTLNPGKIIGRRGKSINELTESLREEFGIENPQISVVEVTKPYLEPRIVAKKATRYIEMGKKVRSVMHFLLREIMGAGAMGAEIVASGKIGAKGARAKTLRVSAGYIPKAGEPMHFVSEAHLNANTKSGIIGVLVRIVPPGTKFPDKEVTEAVALPKVIENARQFGRRQETQRPYSREGGARPAEKPNETKKAEVKKEEKKPETKETKKEEKKPETKKAEEKKGGKE
ncbi:30S ribosomal protein S3 [Candidatus Micrarchaeota archaeon]|nr:30S ribosomal protein S3 [Candidatus Micrarchaeota archaeon]